MIDRVQKGIVYRTGVQANDKNVQSHCQLDLYLPPANVRNFPLLVWFHGGGLTGGNRGEGVPLSERFAAQGVAVANADYRLNPTVKYPAYIEDAAQAVAWAARWAATEGKAQGANPRAIFVGGHSAGGYLASLLAMDPKYLRDAGVAPQSVAGFLPMSGQLITHFTVRAERGLPETALLCDEAAPLYHVRKDAPPIFLLVGDRDMVGRKEEAQLFVTMMTEVAKHKDTRVMIVAERDHSTIRDRVLTPGDNAGPEMLAFIRKRTP